MIMTELKKYKKRFKKINNNYSLKREVFTSNLVKAIQKNEYEIIKYPQK